MDEDFQVKKSNKLNLSMGGSEEEHEHLEEEVELSPIETIVWDCCEVNYWAIKTSNCKIVVAINKNDPTEVKDQKIHFITAFIDHLKERKDAFVLIHYPNK